jgi:hypothetical protein
MNSNVAAPANETTTTEGTAAGVKHAAWCEGLAGEAASARYSGQALKARARQAVAEMRKRAGSAGRMTARRALVAVTLRLPQWLHTDSSASVGARSYNGPTEGAFPLSLSCSLNAAVVRSNSSERTSTVPCVGSGVVVRAGLRLVLEAELRGGARLHDCVDD